MQLRQLAILSVICTLGIRVGAVHVRKPQPCFQHTLSDHLASLLAGGILVSFSCESILGAHGYGVFPFGSCSDSHPASLVMGAIPQQKLLSLPDHKYKTNVFQYLDLCIFTVPFAIPGAVVLSK